MFSFNKVPFNQINGREIRYCADVIAHMDSKSGPLVLIQRISDPVGIAIPGGGQDKGERLDYTATREFKEKTGLSLSLNGVLGTYTNHDPRKDRHSISTVFCGIARGEIKNEPGKTLVKLYTKSELMTIMARQNTNSPFVFHHDHMLLDYFRLIN